MKDEVLRRIEAELFGLVTASTSWTDVLSTVSAEAGTFGATLLPLRARTPGVPASESLSEIQDAYFRDGWAEQDARLAVIPRLLRTGLATDQDYIAPGEMNRHPFWQDFLEPNGLRWFCGVKVEAQDDVWCLAFQRTPRQGPFGPDDQASLVRLALPFSRAATLSRHLGDAHLGGVVDTLDLMESAGILLDRFGRVVCLNRRAEALLGRDISVVRGSLSVARNSPASGAIRRHVEAALWSDIAPDSPDLRPVAVPRPGRRPLLLQAQALRGTVGVSFARARVLVTVTDPDHLCVPGEAIVRKLFPLSEGELRLTLALAVEFNLPAAAKRADLSYETARSYIKSVFEKTGTRSQGQLLSLLASLAHRA